MGASEGMVDGEPGKRDNGRQTAVHGKVDRDHLQHASRQVGDLRQHLALVLEREIEAEARRRQGVLDENELRRHFVVGRANVEPVEFLHGGQIGLVDLAALGQFLRATVGDLAGQQLFDPVEGVRLDDPQLVIEVQAIALELVVDDLLGALVAANAFTSEQLHDGHGPVSTLIPTHL